MAWIRNAARIIVGLVFVFSGFVKGVDPLGFSYRVEDYFVAYGIDWAQPLSLFLSICLIALEFALGVLLLLKVKPRLIAWLTLLIMIYFTMLTFYDALYNPVPDCGCFGDAIKLTNWQTFYKNIVLILLVLIIFVQRKKFRPWFTKPVELLLLILIPLLFVWFSVYNYRNLPMIDFTAWKKGTRMIPDKLMPVKSYLVYQNKSTGESKEFLSSELPWQDTVWMSQWQFKSQRIDDPNLYPAPNFKIIDSLGNDLTTGYLQDPAYVVCLVCVDMTAPADAPLKKLNDFYQAVYQAGYTVVGLTGSLPEEVIRISKEKSLDIPWFQSDDTELKTMIRSNPGLVLLKNGTVTGKWHIRNLPAAADFMKTYPLE